MTTGERLDAATRERLAKNEAWAAHLARVRADYIRRMPLYRNFFLALTAAGFACFSFGGAVGLWGSLSSTTVAVGGYLMVKHRVHELEAEIALVHDDASRIREHAAAGER